MRVNRSFSQAFAASLALILSLAVLSTAQSPLNDRVSKIQIENFGRINENYYRGAQPKKNDFAGLAALGVKAVVDLQREGVADEAAIVESLGMRFYRIGLSSRSKPSSEDVARFLAIVNNPANQPVFVHCHVGRHRTGVMTAIYRLAIDSWTADRAYAEMKQYKFEKGFLQGFFHTELKNYVYDYYGHLSRQNAASAAQKTATSSQ
jgi:protein tyrosine/serine phosphatase